MPEILSQSQIDALLKGYDSGNIEIEVEPKQRIKDYDFKSPMKFTKEQLKALDSLHETFSRLLSSYLSGLLRLYCEVEVLQIEEQRYHEFNNALPDLSLIGMIEISPEDTNFEELTLMLDMSPSIGFMMIDRLLGGPGSGYSLQRDFSDIETAILRNIFERIVGYVEESWCEYVDVKADLSRIETNARLVQLYSPEEIVVIVLMRMKIRDLTGNISICIPSANMEELISRFSSKYVRTSKKTDAERETLRKKLILNSITNSDLEVKAVLHEFQLNLQDVLELQKDDVIPLSKKADENILLKVADEAWFSGKLGQNKLKKAVKVEDLVIEEKS